MRVRIGVGGEPDEGLRLASWLTAALPPDTAEVRVAASTTGEMGAGDIVQAVITDTAALGGLVMAVATWRDSRKRSSSRTPVPHVEIERGGVKVGIDGCDPAEIAKITRALAEATDPEPDEVDGPRGGADS